MSCLFPASWAISFTGLAESARTMLTALSRAHGRMMLSFVHESVLPALTIALLRIEVFNFKDCLANQAMKKKEQIVILDPGRTLIYAPLLGFEDAGNLHAYHVRLAWLALLQRNLIGTDLRTS